MCACGVCVCCVCLCNVFVLMCVSVLCMYLRMLWHPGIHIRIHEDMTYQIVLLLSVCVRTVYGISVLT